MFPLYTPWKRNIVLNRLMKKGTKATTRKCSVKNYSEKFRKIYTHDESILVKSAEPWL